MTFLDAIKSKLTAAVMLKDALSPGEKVTGDVFLTVPEIKNPPLLHSTGYFLFIDTPEGTYDLVAGGNFYKEKTSGLSLKSSQLFYEIYLEPRGNYPFPAGMTVLKGKVVDEAGGPVSGAVIKVKDMAESSVSEDDGCFFIIFKTINADKDITLKIAANEYKAAEIKVTVKNGVTARCGPIILTKQ